MLLYWLVEKDLDLYNTERSPFGHYLSNFLEMIHKSNGHDLNVQNFI